MPVCIHLPKGLNGVPPKRHTHIRRSLPRGTILPHIRMDGSSLTEAEIADQPSLPRARLEHHGVLQKCTLICVSTIDLHL